MIKKLLSATALITGLAFSANAQQYTPLTHLVDSFTNGNAHELVMYNYLTNDVSDSIAVTWQIASIQIPSDWVITGFCDNINCFGDTSTLNGTLSHRTKNFAHGKICQMTFDVTPAAATVNQTGIIKVRVQTTRYNNNDTLGQIDTLVYRINPQGTGIAVISANDARIKIAPNPAKAALTVFADKSLHASKITIVNIAGQVAYTTAITNETSILNINDLSTGLYMIRITDDQGRLVTTRKFTKD